jgi:putative ATP-dependent endonuclease of the OLD family
MKNLYSLYIKGYKCFSTDSFSGFDVIMSLNVVIGRNNTGKSSLLDMISYATNGDSFYINKESFQQIIVGYVLDSEIIDSCFSSSISGGSINGNHLEYGRKFLGKVFHCEISINNNSMYSERERLAGKYTNFKNEVFPEIQKEHWDKIANKIINKLSSFKVIRLGAERNIVPEKEGDFNELTLGEDGAGATNIIHKFINLSTLDSRLVEDYLLGNLNSIINPDAHFTDLVVQQVEGKDGYKWEIFLEEAKKGRISLSKSGSGLKTIILVLIELLLMPIIHKTRPENLIFILEELENNLHPALQRNLFNFIFDWSVKHNTTVFLTTHSHIPINMFSGNQEAQIIHIRNLDGFAIPKVTLDFLDNNNILMDLDVKASDLLQSNGIIWVEGPSDRVYLNYFIDLYSNGDLKEGMHYQIVYYGGRILSHFAADPNSKETALINLLLTNRNCAIVIDSDKNVNNSKINATKKRIQEEFNNIDSIAWVTKGREIENYIPESAIKELFNSKTTEKFTQFMDIKDYLDKISKGAGKRFEQGKVIFAKEIIPLLKKEELDKVYDLKQRINDLINRIRSWN